MKEKQIENQILAWLRCKRIFAWQNHSVGLYDAKKGIFRKSFNRYHINGVSDILGVMHDGRILCIEVKSEKGRLSGHQREFLQTIADNGGIAIVARSVQDVERVLGAEAA